MDLGTDDISINISDNQYPTRINIIEGIFKSQIFTGTGESIQSYEVSSLPKEIIADNLVKISVNGEIY